MLNRDTDSSATIKEVAFAPEYPSDWLVFLYGPLAEPRMDNEWLNGHRNAPADLLDFYLVAAPVPVPVREEGRLVPGTAVYLSPEEIRELDLHPEGRGYRRTTAWVNIGRARRRAQVWLPSA